MLNLLYLGVPIVLAVLVSMAMSLRGRRPRSVEHDVDHFARELRALAPQPPPPLPSRRARQRS